MDFLEKLNKEQKEAVVHTDGPLLIVAGAGTGKTTVITSRIAYLIASGKAKHDEILAVTFTDKAAGEMQERIDRLLPLGYMDLWISTFHSFCQRVLQDYGIEIGLPGNFKLLDYTSQWMMVRQNLDKFDLDYYRPLGNPAKFISALLQHFSRAKDEDISPEEYLEYVENLNLNTDTAESGGGDVIGGDNNIDKVELERLMEVARAYHTYQKLLLENSALDFGDLINYTLKLFRERPKILKYFQDKFKYILIDEFQDTNWSQYELVKMLAGKQANITVVADDDQSIFKFRGASVSNVLQFYKDYPEAKIVSLVENYRSAQEILDLSYKFITLNNPERLEVKSLNGKKVSKKLKSNTREKADIAYFIYPDQFSEAYGVVEKIVDLRKKDKQASWNDFAILIRANSQADAFISVFENHNIPYQYVASKGLYTKRIVLDIINFLRVVLDFYDSPSLWYILHSPTFNIDHSLIIDITHWASKKAVPLLDALSYWANLKGMKEEMKEKIKLVLNMIDEGAKLAMQKKAREVVLYFLEKSGYLEMLSKEDTQENYQELKYLEQFDRKLQEFEKTSIDQGVKLFLEQINMEIESGDTGSMSQDLDMGPECVKLLTVHAAKGLEFKYVFITGMVDKRFPSIDRKDPIELPEALIKEILPEGDIHLQEERRLFYVAMTRAKKGLYFTGAENYGGKLKKKPSRFMYELDMVGKEEYVEFKDTLISHKDLEESVDEVSEKEKKYLQKIYSKLPEKVSFTQFTSYNTCPYQYKLAHILKVPVRANYTLSFGKTMHNTLKRFLEYFRDNTSQIDLFGQAPEKKNEKQNIPDLKTLLNIYEEEWIDEWYESPEHKEKYRKKGEKILKDFYKKLVQNPPHPVYLEQGFNLKLKDEKGNTITIFGVIDRVDLLDDGEVEIIDYKTGNVKKELKGDDKNQLLLYQIAAQEILGLKPKRLTYYYLDDQKPLSFLGDDEDMEKLKKKFFEFYDNLKKADFKPNPAPFKCKHCDYKHICPYKKI